MKDTINYHNVVQKLRAFFLKKGFIEVPVQSRLSILAACEDPHTVSTFTYDNVVWPLPQTGQMWLEYELLKNPSWPGVFCISTSYRNEPNPIEGRHEKIFPMFEFEAKGTLQDLLNLEIELVQFMGLPAPIVLTYDDLCRKYNVEILTAEHEEKMVTGLGKSVAITMFPERTSPFWNMKYAGDKLFNKIDIILMGQETIGSAERSTNPIEMRNFFNTISEGGYADKLYELFGKERVTKELDEFLSHSFIPRFGGGIGITRMVRAIQLSQQ